MALHNTSKLDSILQKFTEGATSETAPRLQAAALVVTSKAGETLYSSAAGNLTFQKDSPSFDQDSVCWVASLTKLVTAVAVMQLVERGLVGLDDDVAGLVPALVGVDVVKEVDEDGVPRLAKATRALTLRYVCEKYGASPCLRLPDEATRLRFVFVFAQRQHGISTTLPWYLPSHSSALTRGVQKPTHPHKRLLL